MTVKIYGIKNCDTMKKALSWLEKHQIEFEFHDYKKLGIPESLAKVWVECIDLELLINKRGTTWRKLDDSLKNSLDNKSAKTIIMEHHSVVKRPLLEVNGKYHLGFKPEQYAEIFS